MSRKRGTIFQGRKWRPSPFHGAACRGDTLPLNNMFLRYNTRKKDGKVHRYWSVVENRRLRAGHTTQRTVLYLGEINDTQQAAWRKSLEVVNETTQRTEQICLFPEDREIPPGCPQRAPGQALRTDAPTSARLRRLLAGAVGSGMNCNWGRSGASACPTAKPRCRGSKCSNC